MGDAEDVVQPAAAQPAPAPVQPAAAPAVVEPFYVRSVAGDRLWQGEILENLPQVRLAIESVQGGDDLAVETDPHPLAVILSQDCDLEQDFRENAAGGSILPNVLLCDLFAAEELRQIVKERDSVGSKEWKPLRQNKNERFQFLHAVIAEEDLKGAGLPELAIDFRQYFTVRTEELYRRIAHGTLRRCRLATPYAEHLADRFSHYLARIALPRDH